MLVAWRTVSCSMKNKSKEERLVFCWRIKRIHQSQLTMFKTLSLYQLLLRRSLGTQSTFLQSFKMTGRSTSSSLSLWKLQSTRILRLSKRMPRRNCRWLWVWKAQWRKLAITLLCSVALTFQSGWVVMTWPSCMLFRVSVRQLQLALMLALIIKTLIRRVVKDRTSLQLLKNSGRLSGKWRSMPPCLLKLRLKCHLTRLIWYHRRELLRELWNLAMRPVSQRVLAIWRNSCRKLRWRMVLS